MRKIRLTESQLNRMVMEAVKELTDDDDDEVENPYQECLEELSNIYSEVGMLKNTFAEREVQGDILDGLNDVQEILKRLLNDVKGIMGGNNPYA